MLRPDGSTRKYASFTKYSRAAACGAGRWFTEDLPLFYHDMGDMAKYN